MDEIVLGYSDVSMTETWLVSHIPILLEWYPIKYVFLDANNVKDLNTYTM